MPPPFPFKLFIVTAGVFRFSVVRFALAVAAGRAFRYTLIGYLAAHYGEHAKELLAQYYPYIGLGLAVLIVAVFVLRNMFKKGSKRDVEGARAPLAGESESELL